MHASLPANEESRLAALRRYAVLDSPPEKDFDDLARLASEICATPMALVSFVDESRQWFKSAVGLGVVETSRTISFCAHAILQTETLLVPDAASDERFADNPFVTGGPRIRFYAGAPLLTSDGLALGTLCVLDRVPRSLASEQAEALRVLARQVITQLEWRRAVAASREAARALKANEEINSRMLEASPDCIKLLDLDARLLSMNAGGMAALEICDFGPLVNSSWIDFWQGTDQAAARQAVETARGGGVGRFTGYFPTTTTRRPAWWDVVVSPIRGADDAVERLLVVSRDVTARARASEMVWAVTDGTALAGGADFFPALVRNLASALQVPYAFVAECTSATRSRVRTLAFWKRDALAENFEYPVAGTPCEAVVGGTLCYHAEAVQGLFPEDHDLVALDAQSYLGLPVTGGEGEVLGHLAILDTKPISEDAVGSALLRTFAARAGMELERLRAANQIAALNLELETAAHRARTLLTINNAVVLNLTQEALFKAIAQALRPVIAFDRITIFLHDAEANRLRLVAAESSLPSSHFEPGLELALDSSHAGWAFVNQRPFFRRDLATERTYPGEDILFREGFRSLIVVPMVVRGKSIGTLNLGSERPVAYGEPEAELLQEVANQVALSIENMREYEEIGRLKAQLERENVYLQEEILGDHNFEEIVGSSPALGTVLRTIDRVAPTDTTVLILGETGTGKELVARAVHSRSGRRKHPLVKVNCGAIPAGLIESELFGHVKGAFTGALERRTGRFELADGGTLFLDEVGELPLEMQVKLLRVLQEHEFEPVGSSRTLKVDVRVIAATNRNIEHEVAAGRFRMDLYYRLNVLPIRVPSLRERQADIPQLVAFFVHRYAKRVGRAIDGVSRATMDLLTHYSWPGNVRELENVLERALVLSPGGVLDIGPDLLPTAIGERPRPADARPEPGRAAPLPASGPLNTLDDILRAHLLATLERTGGVIEGPKGAARILDVHPNTLRSRLKKLGIAPGPGGASR